MRFAVVPGSASVSPLGWTHTSVAQQVHLGPGVLEVVPEVVRALGGRRVLLVTSPGRVEDGSAQRVERLLGRALVATFDQTAPHLPATVVQRSLMAVRTEQPDLVVSLGGGSVVDAAKAVGHFVEAERGTPGASFADRPALPHVALPTTGVGAAFTSTFAITDDRSRAKTTGGGPTATPVVVCIDPLVAAAPAVLVPSAIVALGHAIEVAIATNRTPEAEALALDAIARLAAAVPALVAAPADREALGDLLTGCALAGRALANGWTGLAHGLAQLLGGRTGISHAAAVGLVLGRTLAWNAEVVPEAVERVSAALGDDAVPAIDRLRDLAGLPASFEAASIELADREAVARLSQGNASVRHNPRPTTEDEVLALLLD